MQGGKTAKSDKTAHRDCWHCDARWKHNGGGGCDCPRPYRKSRKRKARKAALEAEEDSDE